MAIVFEQQAPIEAMQAEARAKSAYEQGLQERDYNFRVGMAQAGINDRLRDDAMRRAAMTQSAYQFEASRQPSARDEWAAENAAARDERNFEQQMQGLTQSEMIRMQRLQRQMDYVQEQTANGAYTPEESQELMAQLHGTHGPLALRHQRSQEQAIQAQMRRADDMHAREVTRANQDAEFRARSPQDRLQELTLRDGSVAQFLEDSQGRLTPVVNRTLTEEVAERKMLGGLTRQEIRGEVMDRYRNQFPGLGELTDAGVTELIGQERLDREVSRQVQQRAQMQSVAEQRQNVTATAQQNNMRLYTAAAERDLAAYNQGVPKKPGDPVPNRPLWVQAYINQLGPLERAAAMPEALLGDRNAPVTPEVLMAAQEWHVQRQMNRAARREQQQQGGTEGGGGGGEGERAPPAPRQRGGRGPETGEEAATFRRQALEKLNTERARYGFSPLPDDSREFGERFDLNRARGQLGLPEIPFGTPVPDRDQSWRNMPEAEIMQRLTPDQQRRWQRARSFATGPTGRSVTGGGNLGLIASYYDRQLDNIWAEAQRNRR